MTAALSRSLSSLSIPNYRRYFAGMVVSITGNWMQIVAETWLILRLTGSGAAVGLTAALQFLPILLAGAWGGLLADRLSKRRILSVTQAALILPAVAMGVLTLTGVIVPWMVWALVLIRGTVLAVDNPARQAFPVELVGPERVLNAVSLNSVLIHTGRIAGPALAGVTIATLGVAPCFLVNAVSFGGMLLALRRMDPEALHVSERVAPEPGQIRSALAYVRATPELRIPLLLMAAIGTFGFNFQVLLPLFARFTWHGTAATYALLTATMGVGSILGALSAGARGAVTPRLIARAATAFGAFSVLAALAPDLPAQLALLPLLGAASVTFAAGTNSALQLAVAPAMRGRVMALYSVVFLGSTPIGGPVSGLLAEVAGPRAGLALGGVVALAASVWARGAWTRAAAPARRSVLTVPAAPAA